MGSSCCCEENVQEPLNYDVCQCIDLGENKDPRRCLAAEHVCRCFFSSNMKQSVCLSHVHHCICKLIDERIVCLRHMVPLTDSAQSTGACCVCLTPLSRTRVHGLCVRLTVCAHYYHCKCLGRWLTRGGKTCPMCVRPISNA